MSDGHEKDTPPSLVEIYKRAREDGFGRIESFCGALAARIVIDPYREDDLYANR